MLQKGGMEEAHGIEKQKKNEAEGGSGETGRKRKSAMLKSNMKVGGRGHWGGHQLKDRG